MRYFTDGCCRTRWRDLGTGERSRGCERTSATCAGSWSSERGRPSPRSSREPTWSSEHWPARQTTGHSSSSTQVTLSWQSLTNVLRFVEAAVYSLKSMLLYIRPVCWCIHMTCWYTCHVLIQNSCMLIHNSCVLIQYSVEFDNKEV